MVDMSNLMGLAERFINNELEKQELDYIQSKLKSDFIFQKEWEDSISFLSILHNCGEHAQLKNKIRTTAIDYHNTKNSNSVFRNWINKYAKTTALAASLAIVSSIITYQLAVNSNNSSTNNQFINLKREVENIKSNQAAISQSINENDKLKDAETQETIITGDVVGTGFFLSSEGYLATDYHVVESADSIFIQSHDGKYYKAYLVGFDEKNDIAIIKLENKKARIFKGEIPYTIMNAQAGLSQSIYSIGYPQEDALYSEGYISSKNGLGGDKRSYQLNLPAHPGQSGSPIFDKNGQVIGMLIGKKTFSTYAVKSNVLVELIKSLPEDYKIQLPNTNQLKSLNRQDQVAKSLDYVVPVRVFKK